MLNTAIQKTRSNYGASFKLILNGPAAQLAQEVNTLFNCGAVRNIPDTYKEGDDTQVILDSPKNRFFGGMLSLAETSMVLDGSHRKTRKNKRGWYSRAVVRAAHFAQNFAKGKAWYNGNERAAGIPIALGNGRVSTNGGGE